MLLSYKSKSRISWGLESFNIGRKKVAKVNVRGKSLSLYLALNPETIDAKYHAKNVSESKRFADTPVLIKVRSSRSLKYAFELIEALMISLEMPKRDVPHSDYRPERKTLEELVECGLVKDKLAQ